MVNFIKFSCVMIYFLSIGSMFSCLFSIIWLDNYLLIFRMFISSLIVFIIDNCLIVFLSSNFKQFKAVKG